VRCDVARTRDADVARITLEVAGKFSRAPRAAATGSGACSRSLAEATIGMITCSCRMERPARLPGFARMKDNHGHDRPLHLGLAGEGLAYGLLQKRLARRAGKS
jgi:hypothetical protein